MKKYFISINLIEMYNLDIEANSEEEALEKEEIENWNKLIQLET